MKIKIDENLPASLAKELDRLGHDTHTVFDEQLAGVNDAKLWEAAQIEGRFFITQDLDFSDIQQFRPGSHHGILLVRLRQPGRLALVQHVRRVFMTEDTSSWAGCFLVLTEHKLRIRRPSQ
jgi:predicted nuclease of predicted toxin-antitoxin system